jgi:RHS repeat-associated protein
MGHKKSVSEWGNTGKKTQFLNYDAFGRPTRIRPPDGSTHDVTLAYTGDRVITRNVKVGTTWTGTAVAETTFSTTERYDRQGRLYQLLEASGVNNATTTTTYGYDVGNRLKSVSMPSQSRTFNYDTRGFLTSEVHPETGTITYGNYDARGHAGTRSTGAASLAYTYDRAERLIQVQETAPVNRTLKSWTYSTANSGSNYRNGKVLYATRNNYVAIGATPFKVSFQETFTYAGRDGRVSQRVLSQYTNDGAVSESFTQSWTYDVLGNVISLGYPDCTLAPCTSSPRTVSNTYTKGFLTGVTGFASSLTYHPNLQVNQVTNANGVVTTYGLDPNSMARPASITTTSATPWSSGAYAYDGAGNVTRIGNGRFLYDGVSRLLQGVTVTTPADSTTTRTQTVGYDLYGNIQSITTNGSTLNTPTNSANRLTSSGTAYDAAGNLITGNRGNTYQYDPFGLLWHQTSGAEDWLYMYTADDQRVWAYRTGGSGNYWAIRDLDGKMLREYSTHAGWTVDRDYVYRGDKLLAAVTPQGTRHFHLDHLGSVRQVTNASAAQVAFHAYYPFGREATTLGQDNKEQMQFTGHERDLQNTTAGTNSDADDLDYMHARYYNMHVGRFTSVDPKLHIETAPRAPQRWNRYAYSLNSPLTWTDPDGRDMKIVFDFRKTPYDSDFRRQIASAVAERFVAAGAGRVRTAERVGPSFLNLGTRPLNDEVIAKGSPTIFVDFDRGKKGSAFGLTGQASTIGTVFFEHNPTSLSFLVNVATHEAGHALGTAALIRELADYNQDGRLGASGAGAPGTVMGYPPSALTEYQDRLRYWSGPIREFSKRDADAIAREIGPRKPTP